MGVVVLLVIALIILVWHIGQRHFRRATAMKEKKHKNRDEAKPYLQPKAELEAEETRRNELEGNSSNHELEQGERYEIDGDANKAEMTGLARENGMLPSLMERHELRGEEFSTELAGHDVENH